MHPRFRKVVLALAVLGLAISVGVAACGGDDGDGTAGTTTAETTTETTPATTAPPTTESTETTPPTNETPFTAIRITVENAQPVGGIQRPKLSLGDDAIIYVTSDVADEVHLHGYDLSQEVEAGGTIQIPLHATIPGRFEIELEQRGVQLAELTVS
jgi:hypothetical protein